MTGRPVAFGLAFALPLAILLATLAVNAAGGRPTERKTGLCPRKERAAQRGRCGAPAGVSVFRSVDRFRLVAARYERVVQAARADAHEWHSRADDLQRRLTARVREVQRLRRALEQPRSVEAVVCGVFGPYCAQALDVADCETGGTFSTSARNGEHVGIFQMGDWERRTYGDGQDAWSQALAALRYFLATGASWGPWQCRP